MLRYLGLCFIFASFGLGSLASEDVPKADVFPTGQETVARFTLPPGFYATCFAHEPEVRKPIAIDFDERGRVWVLECYAYPHKQPPGQGRDRIRVYEDMDGDGVADKIFTFAEGLNLATGMALGHGGVFVGEPPELVFLRDTNGDGVADQRVVLLDGWGYQDTHETLNSFIWGPDGWLYGCHGVFTHSAVGKPGTPPEQRVRLNAAIWRFHPRTQAFEVFAEGTSNPWGFDFDENGSGFLACCVIPHLFHIYHGGHYVRQAGQNFNPFNYGEIPWICEDLHYFGPNPHFGNRDPRSLKFGGGHAHAGCLIYQGGSFPQEWHGRVYMNNIHGGRINTDSLRKNGSTYIGNYKGDLLVANDPNFRVVQLRTGPDGSIFMIDWYDPQICHNTNSAIWNRNYGRIYKIGFRADGASKDAATQQPMDLSQKNSAELVELLAHNNSWMWRKALLILGERKESAVIPALKQLATSAKDYRHRLRALWALLNMEACEESFAVELLRAEEPWVRFWALHALAHQPADWRPATQRAIQQWVQNESHPDVLRGLLSLVQYRAANYPAALKDILTVVGRRDALGDDPVLPFMYWFAYEALARATKDAATPFPDLLTEAEQSQGRSFLQNWILPRAIRRKATLANEVELNSLLLQIGQVKHERSAVVCLQGLQQALDGRRLDMPAAWQEMRADFGKRWPQAHELLRLQRRVGIHFGDQDSVADMEKEVHDAKLPVPRRLEALRSLLLARMPTSLDPVMRLTLQQSPRELRLEALRGLAVFDSDEIAPAILKAWLDLPQELKKEAVVLLTGRKSWAGALLDAVKTKAIDPKEITENDIKRILAHRDQALSQQVEQSWGKLRERTPEHIEQQLAKYRAQLHDMPGDRRAGRAIFEKSCMVCHKLFGEGHTVGPELTGSNRRDPEYILAKIIDPNRVVGKDYYAVTILDTTGRIHTGLLAEDSPQRIVLKGENDKLTTIPRSDIDEMKISEKTLMPEGIPNNLNDQEFRDLIAYLMEDPFLTHGLVAGPFKMALDLAGPIETAPDPLHASGIEWKPFAVGPFGKIDMEKLKVLAPPTDSTAYVYVEVHSPRMLKTFIEAAADEDLKVWLNGKEVHRRLHSYQGRRFDVELKEGKNTLLFKIHNIYGPSWLWARIGDPERLLTYPPIKHGK